MGERMRGAVILVLWIIFAGIGLATTIRFVVNHIFQSGGRCDMIESLRDLTYMVRHNPNCPKRFEVRLTGIGLRHSYVSGIGNDHDDIGYGDTADEAAANALAAKQRREWKPQFREVWDGL